MLFLVVGCEIAFWVVLAAGLTVRYLCRLPRTGAAILAGVPLVDLVLLVATIGHLRSGAPAHWADGLAAVYLGVSVAYGRQMMHWADVRFAHRFAGGAAPPKPPRTGPAHARRERANWYRHLLAFTIGCTLLLGASALVDHPAQARVLLGYVSKWTLVLGIDFLWSFSYTIWPRSTRRDRSAQPQATEAGDSGWENIEKTR